MATFLDLTALQAFSKVFVFLIALFGAYIVFSHSKWFGGHQVIAWVIAVAAAVLMILSDTVTGIVQHVTPWLAVLMFFVIFIGIAAQMFGGDGMNLDQFKGVFFVIIVLVFVVGTLAYLRTQVTAPGDVDANGKELAEQDYVTTSNFVFHPKFMGIIFILLIAIFTVALMAGKTS